MNDASSDAKNTAAVAMSDGSDRRPSGIEATNFALAADDGGGCTAQSFLVDGGRF